MLPACDPVAAREVFDRFEYKPFSPAIAHVKGQFTIARTGVVFPSLKWSLRTNYRHHPTRFLHIIAASVWSVFSRGRGQMTEAGRPFALIHSAWTGGYYHWLTESMVRALQLRKAGIDCIPMLPSEAYFQYAPALHALGHREVARFPAGRNAIVSDPVLTTCPPSFGTTNPELLNEVRAKILNYYGLANSQAEDIVYVSRRKSRGRVVLNEVEINHVLERAGARIVCFEDLDFEAQVRLMARTKCLISIKGAGLTNMMFMPPGGVVVELLPKRNGIFDYGKARMSFRHDPCYLRLSAAMGHRYGYLLCAHDAKRWQATQMSNINVDANALLAMLSGAGVIPKAADSPSR